MKQSIQLRLGQHLTMTPQLQQAIRLLQLSTIELNAEIQQVLDSNMMLERAEDGDEDPALDEHAEAPGQVDEPQLSDDADGAERVNGSDVFDPVVDGAGDGDAAAADDFADVVEARDSGAAELGSNTAQEIPEELPVDSAWEDVFDGPSSYSGAGDSDDYDFENSRGVSESLHDHLLWQLNVMQLSPVDRLIALAIIDAVGADGYLSCSLEEIRLALAPQAEVEPDEIEAMLRCVQSFEPTGVAARDLRECLLLQLAQLPAQTPRLAEARLLVADYLDMLAARDYATLMRRLKLDREALQQVIALIQSQRPRPGALLGSPPNEYITPDVYVRRKGNGWHVELNPETVPHLRVNRRYAGYIRRADSSPDNVSLRAHLQEARWFIKSLQSRSETLLRVATAIVERQRAFLEQGEEAMKPLVLHDIAEVLGMHESTISRVTTRKYMHTPRGIFELKYFFSSHVSTEGGGEASSTAIRAVIRKLIAGESPSRPLSDSRIASVLSEQGVNVARRTVAKYREAMAIPPSNERKRLA